MTKTRVNPIAARAFALRFAVDAPTDVIASVIDNANDIVTGEIGGFCYFPLETFRTTHNGNECLAVHLHADEEGWEQFRRRGFSIVPATVAASRVSVHNARPRNLDALAASARS